MKIGLVCPASLPATQFGGIMFLCLDIARGSAALGHNVTIYTTDLDFANNATTFNKNLSRKEIIDNFTIKRSHTWFRYSLFFVNPGIYFQMMKDAPDIIHTIGIRSFQSFIAAIVSKKKKIPLVISDQGGLTTHPDLKNSNFFKKILHRAQFILIKFIINLETLKTSTKDFKKKYNLNSKFILFIGRFSKVKGIDVLLNAIKIIKNRTELQNFKFVIMGVDFGFQDKMFEMINDLHIKEKILVIKNPSREDVIAAYKESEFLVLPSRWELSPLTPLEGFAFKKSVISTNTHGIPFTIKHGIQGILVEPENYQQLADAILELVKDENKRNSFGIAGFDMVTKECNSLTMTKNTLKIYEKILDKTSETVKT